MSVRAILSILIIFLGFLTAECRKCFNSVSNSLVSNYNYRLYGECPSRIPKCCGIRQDACATTCVNFECETNDDCDGLTCCSGNCSSEKNCLPVTTWAIVGIAVVSLFLLLALCRISQWCCKRKVSTRQNTRTTSEEQAYNDPPPFVVSDFENHGFVTPMAPPSYESVVQNTGSRTDDDALLYNLNLQTRINNSSTDDPGSNNLEVNISIRGSAMFINDFPPSYSEISNSGDGDGQQPYGCQEVVENFEERLTLNYANQPPPPYSLDEESTSEESPSIITREESPSNTTTDSSIDEDSTLIHYNASRGERQTVSSSISEADNQSMSTHSSNVNDNSESRDEILSYESTYF